MDHLADPILQRQPGSPRQQTSGPGIIDNQGAAQAVQLSRSASRTTDQRQQPMGKTKNPIFDTHFGDDHPQQFGRRHFMIITHEDNFPGSPRMFDTDHEQINKVVQSDQ
jgi:hypothetical protein